MRKPFILLLLICFAPAMSGESVTFAWQPPTVNRTQTEVEERATQVDLTASVNGQVLQKVVQQQQESTRIRTTVLAVAEHTIATVRASCEKAVQRVTGDEGKLEEIPNPCQGKSYLITSKTDQQTVTYEDGKQPSAEEIEWLQEHFSDLGEEDPFAKILNGKTLKVGEKLNISAEMAATLMNVKQSGLKVEAFALALKAIQPQGERKHAVFDTALTISQTEGGIHMAIELKGEITVDASTCWPLNVSIQGPLKTTGQQKQDDATIELSGAGTMSSTVTYEYGE